MEYAKKILFMMTVALLLTACDEKLSDSLSYSPVTVRIDIPADAADGEISDPRYEFLNISSGRTSVFDSPDGIELLPGLYNVTFHADLTLPGGTVSSLRAARQSVEIGKGSNLIELTAFNSIESDDLIISEIFFSGTLHTSGNNYNGDDYVKLYNNTDHTIYADGLTLFETKFTTTQKYDYTPDIMADAVTVQALYTIPGSGTDHPVEPGEFLLLADTGIDHRIANPNSFDLRHADFEWYDVSSVPSNIDIDSPDVPNLDKWYCYTNSFFVLHNRGLKAYGIARIPVERDTYLSDYYYTYDYDLVTAAGTFPMSNSAYRLPNEWVVDIVNCSIASSFAWTLCAPQLDMGWTHCGTIDHDKTRYFHAVRRKLLYINEKGNPVYKDTNNSTLDFNADVTPSEIELQGTPASIDGTPASTITYDGITPVE